MAKKKDMLFRPHDSEFSGNGNPKKDSAAKQRFESKVHEAMEEFHDAGGFN
jgi:hypothetical protein